MTARRVAVTAGAVAGVGWLAGRELNRQASRWLAGILGDHELGHRVARVEQEIRGGDGASLRDVADRVASLASVTLAGPHPSELGGNLHPEELELGLAHPAWGALSEVVEYSIERVGEVPDERTEHDHVGHGEGHPGVGRNVVGGGKVGVDETPGGAVGAVLMGTAPELGWRALAGPISWWEQRGTGAPAMTPAHEAAIDGVQAELRESFARAGLDITDPTVLQPALLAVAFLRVTARRDAQLGRLTADEVIPVLDAVNPVGVALTRWVPKEARP